MKLLLSITLLVSSMAFANRTPAPLAPLAPLAPVAPIAPISVGIDDRGVEISFGQIRDLRQCKRQLTRTRDKISELQSLLRQCQDPRPGRGGRGDARRIRDLENQLAYANQTIASQNQTIDSQENMLARKDQRIDRLLDKVAELEELLYPSRPVFDLGQSIRACGKISMSTSSNDCVSYARQYSIPAIVIDGCAKISSSSSAALCVKYAGLYNGNGGQSHACSRISMSSSATDCMKYAAKGNVPADVVNACVDMNSSSSSAARCVQQSAQ